MALLRDRPRWTMGKVVAIVAAAAALAAACNDVGDQICPAGSFDPSMRSADCPYGPPGGPKVRETGCPDIMVDMTGPACGTLSWDDDIWPLLTSGQSNPAMDCANAACHDPPSPLTPAGGLHLPAMDPEAAYTALEGYMPTQGYPYVSDMSPAHTWILCNLHGDEGGSQPMPPPPNTLIADADDQKVVTWAQCGEPRTKTGGGDAGTDAAADGP